MSKCVKCGKPEYARWHFCSHGKAEPICLEHDIELNEMALKFRFPRSWKRRLETYKRQVIG